MRETWINRPRASARRPPREAQLPAGIYEVGYDYLESLGLGPAAEPYPIHLKVTDVVSGFSDTADSALMIVPEPASALILLVGFACVGRRRMRR